MRYRWLLVALVVLLVGAWWFTRDTLPDPVRIATAAPGGEYRRFAEIFSRNFSARTGVSVELIETEGSVENAELLERGAVDFAVIQLGSVAGDELVIAAPLYAEPMFLVVRGGAKITSVGELAGKMVALGPRGSGMRESALKVLGHYGLGESDISMNERYFKELLKDEELDAAIVTTGMLNPDLGELMATGDFELVPVSLAAAISAHYPFLDPIVIPRGLFRGDPPVPDKDTPSVQTTASLAVRRGAPAHLVEAALGTLYRERVRNEVPSLIGPATAKEWDEAYLHPAVWDYHDPWDGLELLAGLLEGLAGFYELLFAIAAGFYLLWRRRRHKQEEAEKARILKDHDKLDVYLDKTVAIEEAQMECSDPKRLEGYLDDVTRIKLAALAELSHESLRGDPRFLIFLTQCANLITKIQWRIGPGGPK